MKTILLALPLALGLAACATPYGQDPYGQSGQGPYGYPPAPAPYPQPYPNPYPYPQPAPYPGPGYTEAYHAVGTEPGWSLDLDGQMMRFTGDYGRVTISEPTPPRQTGVAGEIYHGRRIDVNIVHGRCTNGMNDRTYPDSVQVTADGRLYRGCGGPAATFGQTQPPYPGTTLPGGGTSSFGSLAQTNWRVLSINGRPVPSGPGYYLNFMPDRINAKFGCNTLGAGYSTQGEYLNAGAIMATRMACGDMSFETAGSNVLSSAMRVNLSNPERLILTNSAGSIEAARVH